MSARNSRLQRENAQLSDAIAPDVLWWGDMTEIDTGEGRLDRASVHDAFSRRALVYAMGKRHDAALVSAALQMALGVVPGSCKIS